MPWPLDWFKALRGESADAAQSRPTAQRATHEWASIPPIQPTAGSLETTSDSLGFVRGLPGRTGPEPALQPLGHRRSLEAPRGLADLALGAVQSYAGQEGMTLKRRPTPVQALRWPEEGEEAPPRSAPEEVRLDGPAVPEPVAAPDPTGELPPPAGPRPVAAVPLPAPITASLTRAPLDLAPPNPSPPVAPVAPVLREVPASPEARIPAVQTSAAERERRINLGQARRLGLGPPLPLQPAVQRSPAEREGPSPGLEALELNPPSNRAEPTGKVGAETTRTHPILRIQRKGAIGSEQSNDVAVPPPVADSSMHSPAVADSTAVADRSPAMSDSPVSFALSPREPGLRFTAAGANRLPVVQPLRESAAKRKDLSGSGQAVGVLPLTAQRTPAAAHQPLISVQRGADRLASVRLPQGGEKTLSSSESPPASAALPDLPLAPPAPSAPADSPFKFEFGTSREQSRLPPAAQRATAAPLRLPDVEYSPAPGSSPVQRGFDVPAVQRAEMAAAPGAGPGGDATPASSGAPGAAPAPGQSEKELDDLARKLYDRFRYHLRSELLIDRERAGVLTDLR